MAPMRSSQHTGGLNDESLPHGGFPSINYCQLIHRHAVNNQIYFITPRKALQACHIDSGRHTQAKANKCHTAARRGLTGHSRDSRPRNTFRLRMSVTFCSGNFALGIQRPENATKHALHSRITAESQMRSLSQFCPNQGERVVQYLVNTVLRTIEIQ